MFELTQQYSVDIASIDGQHQNLFRLAEELYTAMSSGQGKTVLAKILDRLIQYTSVHFSYEEGLMRQCGYPDLAAHHRQHEDLVKQVQGFQSDYQAGHVAMTVQVLEFLKDWLQHHIAGTDQKYAPFLKAKAVA